MSIVKQKMLMSIPSLALPRSGSTGMISGFLSILDKEATPRHTISYCNSYLMARWIMKIVIVA